MWAWPRPSNRSAFVTGMQKHKLTMFRKNCYSSLVPRVNPGLLYAVSPILQMDSAVELLKCVSGE